MALKDKSRLLGDYLSKQKNAQSADATTEKKKDLLTDYLEKKTSASGGNAANPANLGGETLLSRVANPSINKVEEYNRFKASEREEADRRAAQQAKRAEAIKNPGVIDAVGDASEATPGDNARYVQERGRNAFAAFNENLNTIGEGIYQGGKAFIDEFGKAENGSSLDDAFSAFWKGYKSAWDDAAKENYIARIEQETEEKFKNSASNPVVKLAADGVSALNAMLPSMAVSAAAGPVAAGVMLGAQTMPGSYIEARNSGATQDQALAYSALEGVNAGIGEFLIGGLLGKGTGLIGKGLNAVTKGAAGRFVGNMANSLAKSPLGKTLVSAGAKSLGEGAEEIAQGLISTLNEKLTYNPDAKVDAGELAYEGLLGSLMGGTFQAVSLPSQYQAYRSDYDTVNGFSLAAEAVRGSEDVEMLKNIGDSIIKQADELTADSGADNDVIQRTSYVKQGIQQTLDLLEKNADVIIEGNTKKADALETVISSNAENAVDNLINLVTAVSGDGGTKSINKTVDFVLGEIQNAKNLLAETEDSAVRARINENLINYQTVETSLRNNRKKILTLLAEKNNDMSVTDTNGDGKTERAEDVPVDEAQGIGNDLVEGVQGAEVASPVESPVKENAPQTTAEEPTQSAEETEIRRTPEAVNISAEVDAELTGNVKSDAETLLERYRGVRGAVNKLREIFSNGSADAQSLEYIKTLDAEIRNQNRAYVQKKANAYSAVLKNYGIKNVVVDDSLAYKYDGNDVRANGYYDRNTGEIHISPYLSEDAAFGSIIAHEFTHRGAQTDTALVNALLEAKEKIESSGAYKSPDRAVFEKAYSDLIADFSEADAKAYIDEEIAAHFMQDIMENEDVLGTLAREDRTLLQRILDFIVDFFDKGGRENRAAEKAADKIRAMLDNTDAANSAGIKVEERIKQGKPVSADEEIKYSREFDEKFMDAAEQMNEQLKRVPVNVMADARTARAEIKKIFEDPTLADSLNLPPENIGNTYIPNGSYDGTEENTTVCIRSLAADALMDAVAEHLGRPLTVEDTIAVSQEYWRFTDQPECLYCYVAMDRKAYREFLGSYLEQRDDALRNIRSGMSKEEAYSAYLDGRKDTKPQKARFDMWLKNEQDGAAVITSADLASDKSMKDAIARDPSLEAQINDARKYAQGASWAKKRIGYTAYNNHILNWNPDRISKLNSQFGLRMYSFSDFSPAFILENMQMITDASVRGLKMLGYTKDINFAKIFAPSGININISTFAYEQNGEYVQDGMQGADWTEAQKLREQYDNVGVTFVAVNDGQVEWAIAQDWIDVVIPFHLVRTGSKVAEHFGWTNYTQMSGDVKNDNWKSGDKKSIYPSEHQNSKEAYMAALERNNLKPRFEKWVDDPNYMKLVNETRRSAGDTPAVQPKFDLDAAKAAIEEMRKRGGYYVPVGKTDENMQEIAGEIAEKIRAGEDADVRFSRELDESDFTYKNLISKPDMKIVKLESPELFEGIARPSRSEVVKAAIDNARAKNNPKNTLTNTFVRNKDTDTDILVGKNGIEHGLTRSYLKTALASAYIGDLIENAVLINEHSSRANNGEGGIYLSVGSDGEELYICRIITNDSKAIEEVEVMYALNAKKESAAHYRLGSGDDLRSNTDSVISIAELLDLVKKYFADVLPADVLRTMEMVRPASTVSESVKYSRELETDEQRTIRRQQERIDYLAKQLRSHTAFGWAKTVSPTARRDFASEIAAEIPGISTETVSAAVKEVWDIFETAKKDSSDTAEARVDAAVAKAREVAMRIVSESVANEVNPMYEQYNDLRNRLRNTPVRMTISENEFGGETDYKTWRRTNIGLLRVSDSPDALPIDTFYQELSVQYPEFFPVQIENEADQLKRLGDAAVELKKIAGNKTQAVNPFEDIAESFASDLANRILYGFDRLARVTPGAKHEYGALKNEQDVREAYAEGAADAAFREQSAYERGEAAGRERNEKEVQAAYEREEIQRQIFERDFREAQNKFKHGLEQQNRKIIALERRIERRSENNRLTMARKQTLATLNRLNTMLTKPNRSKHIPQELRAPVARLLASLGTTRLPNGKTMNALEMLAINDAEYGRFETECARAADDMRMAVSANRVSADNAVTNQFIDAMTANVERLKQMYAEMNPASPDDVVLPPDLAVSRQVDYIRQVGRILGMVEHYVKDSNVVFLNNKAVSAKEFSEHLVNDLRIKNAKVQKNGEASRLREFISGVGYEFVSADLFFEMMGESGVELMREYRRGQTRQAAHEQEFADYMLEVTGGKYSTHDVGFNGELIPLSISSNGLKVTKSQLMQLYITWKRPAGRRHLMSGGAVFTNEVGQEAKINTIRITQDIYDDLIAHLSDEDKKVADAIGSFLSRRCAEWGNEASMKMYGYRMFEDPFYFPLDVSKNVLPANWDSLDEFYRLENAGMTKALKSDASAPLRMTDIFDIADHHVRTMAAYSAFAPVSNDVQRIMNMPNVREAVNYGMGKKGVQYLDTLMKTIASNKVRNGDMSDAAAPLQFFMNAYKRQAVAFNLSTAIKQPLSIVRALNEIDGKYIRQAPAIMAKAEYQRIYDTMLEHSGVAKMKMLGFSDTGFAKSMRQIYDTDYTRESGVIRGSLAKTKGGRNAVKAYDKITDAGMWAAGKMDEVTWVRLWKACELEVADKFKGLSQKDAVAKTAERFNEIIGRTQVVDTILDTSPLMRNNAMSILTPFMNEPTKALATIITAADAVRDRKSYGKQKLRKAVGLVMLNNLVLEPIISTLLTMWKDEEDDTENLADFSKKFLKLYAGVNIDDGFTFTEFATSNVVGGVFSFPIVQIFYETFADSAQNYSNEKVDTAALTNLIKNTKNLITNLPKAKEDRAKSNYRLFADFLGSASAAIGIPLPTLRKQVAALYRTGLELTDSYELQWEYNKMLYNLENSSARSQKGFYDIMAAAYKAGDTDAYRKMRAELSEIVSDTPSVISPKSIAKAIEERGAKIEVGSDLWYVDLQARFCLDKFAPKMQAESLITKVYVDAAKKGLETDSLLLNMPSAYEYENANGEEQKMTAAEYEEYIREVGLLSYQILVEMNTTSRRSAWSSLTTEQQIYAIEKAYAYAKAKNKKDFDSGYNIRSQGVWMDELYSASAGQAKIASAIIARAKEQ